jgi:pSer/pThr/pTyr-binding forkhead associated (FHA) protein
LKSFREVAVVDLVVLSGPCIGACFAIPDVPIVVGRSPEANVHIDDPWISNMHALIERRGGELWVVDLGSRNGTFVDGQRVIEARVRPGSAVAFGQTRLELRHRTAASARESALEETPLRRKHVSVTIPHQVSRRASTAPAISAATEPAFPAAAEPASAAAAEPGSGPDSGAPRAAPPRGDRNGAPHPRRATRR